jgi:hypothetical protein
MGALSKLLEMPPPRVAPPLTAYQKRLTAVYCSAFGYMGILMSALGPALLTLGEHVLRFVSFILLCRF